MIKKLLLLNLGLNLNTITSMQIQQPSSTIVMQHNPTEIVTTTKGWTWFIENLYNPFMKTATLIGVLIMTGCILQKLHNVCHELQEIKKNQENIKNK